MENWLNSSLKQIQGWTTVRESCSHALEPGPLSQNHRVNAILSLGGGKSSNSIEGSRLRKSPRFCLFSTPLKCSRFVNQCNTLWGVLSVTMNCFFSFGSPRYQLGCTVDAVSAQRPVEHVKNALHDITTEWTPHSLNARDRLKHLGVIHLWGRLNCTVMGHRIMKRKMPQAKWGGSGSWNCS